MYFVERALCARRSAQVHCEKESSIWWGKSVKSERKRKQRHTCNKAAKVCRGRTGGMENLPYAPKPERNNYRDTRRSAGRSRDTLRAGLDKQRSKRQVTMGCGASTQASTMVRRRIHAAQNETSHTRNNRACQFSNSPTCVRLKASCACALLRLLLLRHLRTATSRRHRRCTLHPYLARTSPNPSLTLSPYPDSSREHFPFFAGDDFGQRSSRGRVGA